MSTKIARRLLGRRRTGGGIAVAALAALAAVLVLGGCADGTHPGAAAVVGDTEITVQQVDETSRAVSTALGQPFGPGVALNELVRGALVAEVVEQRSVTITDAEVAAAMKAVIGDQAAYNRFQANPVAKDFLREVAETAVGTVKLGGGTSITDQSAQQAGQAGTKAVSDAAKNITVDVSPRYGQWADGQIKGVSGSLSEESAQAKADREQREQREQQQQQQQQPEQPQG